MTRRRNRIVRTMGEASVYIGFGVVLAAVGAYLTDLALPTIVLYAFCATAPFVVATVVRNYRDPNARRSGAAVQLVVEAPSTADTSKARQFRPAVLAPSGGLEEQGSTVDPSTVELPSPLAELKERLLARGFHVAALEAGTRTYDYREVLKRSWFQVVISEQDEWRVGAGAGAPVGCPDPDVWAVVLQDSERAPVPRSPLERQAAYLLDRMDDMERFIAADPSAAMRSFHEITYERNARVIARREGRRRR